MLIDLPHAVALRLVLSLVSLDLVLVAPLGIYLHFPHALHFQVLFAQFSLPLLERLCVIFDYRLQFLVALCKMFGVFAMSLPHDLLMLVYGQLLSLDLFELGLLISDDLFLVFLQLFNGLLMLAVLTVQGLL